MTLTAASDAALVEVFLEPIRKCAKYKPAFGQVRGGGGLTLGDFRSLYGNDPFYAWLGLDDPLVYTAHKAAGGITSIYRQVGVGAERLTRAILRSSFGLDEQQLNWSYEYPKERGKAGVHTLDAKLALNEIPPNARGRVQSWLAAAIDSIPATSSGAPDLLGAVFEVRQGYKSADSKRQNADLRFGMRAYQARLLPAVMLMSAQVSAPVAARYRNDGMLVLTGVLVDDPLVSTFAFFEHVVGYDIAAFYERNSAALKTQVSDVMRTLLSP